MTSHGRKSLYETFDVLGTWWRPSRPKNRVEGVLHVDCTARLKLRLGSTFRRYGKGIEAWPFAFPPDGEFSTLYGYTEKHEKVTLIGVNWTSIGATSDYIAYGAIFGAHVRNYRSSTVLAYAFSTVGLDDWIPVPRPEYDITPTTLSAKVHKEQKTTLDLRKHKLRVDVESIGMATNEGHKHAVDLHYDVQLRVTPDKAIQWAKMLSTMQHLQRFLMLCSFRSMQVNHLKARLRLPAGRGRNEDEPCEPTTVYLFLSQNMKLNVRKPKERPSFTLKTLGDGAALMLERWITIDRRMMGATNVVFGDMLRPSPYQEQGFFHAA